MCISLGLKPYFSKQFYCQAICFIITNSEARWSIPHLHSLADTYWDLHMFSGAEGVEVRAYMCVCSVCSVCVCVCLQTTSSSLSATKTARTAEEISLQMYTW